MNVENHIIATMFYPNLVCVITFHWYSIYYILLMLTRVIMSYIKSTDHSFTQNWNHMVDWNCNCKSLLISKTFVRWYIKIRHQTVKKWWCKSVHFPVQLCKFEAYIILKSGHLYNPPHPNKTIAFGVHFSTLYKNRSAIYAPLNT